MSVSTLNETKADSASTSITAPSAEGSTSAISFGSVLAAERDKRGVTVNRLSRRMGMKTPGLLTRWEGGIRVPTAESIDGIAEALEPDDDLAYITVRARLRVAAGLIPTEIDRSSFDAHMDVFSISMAMEELNGPERTFVEDVSRAARTFLESKMGG